MSDTAQSIQYLPINYLQPNPLQPRGTMDQEELSELMSSIKLHGILEPIVVAHTPAGYQIVAGERRWKAAKQIGLKEVPCIVKETNPKGMLEMAIIENVQRVDLHPLDRAKAIDRLLNEFHLTVGQIADRLGKSNAYISNSLRLLTMPDALKDGLLSGAITEGHARALSAIKDTRAMVEAYKTLLVENGSVRRAEDLARRMKAKTGQAASAGYGHSPYLISEDNDKWQAAMQQYFGERAKVKLNQSRTQTKVQFVFKGTPYENQRLLDRIMELTKEPLPEGQTNANQITLDSFETTEIVIE